MFICVQFSITCASLNVREGFIYSDFLSDIINEEGCWMIKRLTYHS